MYVCVCVSILFNKMYAFDACVPAQVGPCASKLIGLCARAKGNSGFRSL